MDLEKVAHYYFNHRYALMAVKCPSIPMMAVTFKAVKYHSMKVNRYHMEVF